MHCNNTNNTINQSSNYHENKPGEHAEKCMDYLSCEGNTHLDSQSLKERQEEGQHLICHFWKKRNISQPKVKAGFKNYNVDVVVAEQYCFSKTSAALLSCLLL